MCELWPIFPRKMCEISLEISEKCVMLYPLTWKEKAGDSCETKCDTGSYRLEVQR